MAAILVEDIFKCILLNENDIIPIQISLKLVPRSRIDNKAALAQVVAWRRTNAEKRITDANMRQEEMSFNKYWKTIWSVRYYSNCRDDFRDFVSNFEWRHLVKRKVRNFIQAEENLPRKAA